ncbi:TPA: hypothetical protein N0F65_001754 [Lagenidium giganteum]|uniref:ALMS motif domain-containing protein n=1 Tax=Lagenidium giganteum TaxID=4803 RepID=A0AAV2Z4C6_9STRA|nr:TPA: hypothetical protein N0F65_001754 [Lagenidium giganteum]
MTAGYFNGDDADQPVSDNDDEEDDGSKLNDHTSPEKRDKREISSRSSSELDMDEAGEMKTMPLLPPVPMNAFDMSRPPPPAFQSLKDILGQSRVDDPKEELSMSDHSERDSDASHQSSVNARSTKLTHAAAQGRTSREILQPSHGVPQPPRKAARLFIPFGSDEETKDDEGRDATPQPSLADAFHQRHPAFRDRSAQRQEILRKRREELEALRAKRQQEATATTSNNGESSQARRQSAITPCAASATTSRTPVGPRGLIGRLASGERPKISAQEMRERNKRLYQKLPEVVERRRQEELLAKRRQRLNELRDKEQMWYMSARAFATSTSAAAKARRAKRDRRFITVGLPLLLFVVGGYGALSQFVGGKFEARDHVIKSHSERAFDLDEEYRQETRLRRFRAQAHSTTMGRRRSTWKDKKGASAVSLLLLHAKAGDVEALQKLLAQEFPADREDADHERSEFLQVTQDHNGSTALHLAASEGHCEMIRALLRDGAGEIHLAGGRKKYAKTPLHEAATNGHLDACKLLVEYGFLVDCHTTRGRTPLMYATKGNYVDLVRYLVQNCHANVNEQNEMGVTPIYIASQDGHEQMVELLIELGADPNIYNRTCHSPLHEAVAGGFGRVAAFLMDHGANKHAVDAMGVTIWHEAAGNGDVELLELLLRYDVSLHPNGEEQVDKVMARHPFHYAAVEGKAAFVQAMLDRKLVDANMVDADGCTAIYYASANGHADVLTVLLAAGGDPNIASVRRAPLHCAVEWRRLACVQLLLKHGADVNVRDKNQQTPLAIAQAQQFDDICACFASDQP